MKKTLLVFLLFTWLSRPVFAEQVYADLVFEDSNEIYRIKTDNESISPIGLVYTKDNRSLDFFIDIINNHRFVFKKNNLEKEYKSVVHNIYRQVFDGAKSDSDRGRLGNPTCFDSRDELIEGEKGKPVYRTQSVVFSIGPGQIIEESVAEKELYKGEYDSIEDKNWYSIPNGSWFQTWFSASSASNISYDIFYDRWEEKEDDYMEEVWRGDSLFRAFERNIGIVPTRRLLRAKVDGALEKIENGELKVVTEMPYKTSFFMLPGMYNKESKIGCYYWVGNKEGKFYISGAKKDIKPIYESKDEEKRFACYGTAITGIRKYYILGTDILKQWLSRFGFPTEKAECTKVTFIALEKSLKTLIYIYSQRESCLYRFIISEEDGINIGLPKKINLDFNIATMSVTENGTLYIASEIKVQPKPELDKLDGIEMETNMILDSNNNESDSESFKKLNNKSLEEDTDENLIERNNLLNFLSCEANCQLILSRAYYQKFYKLSFGNEKIDKLDYELLLGKQFYASNLYFKKISLARLNGNLETLLEEAKKPGNKASEIISDVPGYLNSLKIPKSIHIAVFSNQ